MQISGSIFTISYEKHRHRSSEVDTFHSFHFDGAQATSSSWRKQDFVTSQRALLPSIC